jgi:hypothetical protein
MLRYNSTQYPNRMKMQRLIPFAALLMASFIYLSCQKTDTSLGPEPGKGHIVENVQASIAGRILDDQQMPVAGAIVKVGTSQTTSDINGHFSFTKLQVDRTATLVKVAKEGFFEGLKTLVVKEGKEHEVVLQLIKKAVAGTFTASQGGTITVPDAGGTIIFEANTLMNPANRAGYTGPVTVHAFFINPTAVNFQEIMPGTLRGIDANNNVMGLQSFGMMAVELSGSNGEKLQLAGGRKATLRFPIPAKLLGEAPATIPLWFLNDSTGLWQEEGVATRQDNEYVGQVSHFSFWNCDAPFPVVEFTATLQTQQNSPLSGARVVISGTGADSSLAGYGITNSDGSVAGLIPANRPLRLNVYDKCGNLRYTQNAGPYSAKTDLGTIHLTLESSQLTVSGTVADCSAAPVANGYVTIELDEMRYRVTLINGAFNTTIARCINTPATVRLVPYDITRNQAGSTTSLTVAGTTAEAGQLTACGATLSQFINFKIDGASFAFTPPADSMQAGRHLMAPLTMVVAHRKDGSNNRMQFNFRGEMVIGPGPMDYMNIELGDKLYINNGTDTVHITEFGTQVGGYVAGSYNGTVKDEQANRTLPFQMNFRVRRWNW